jgi:CPA1 family monovalent cation:H+ antiporter
MTGLGSETFLYVFLPVLLFHAALTIDVRQLLQDAAPVLLLAVVAVVVSTVVIGFALAPVASVSAVACLMLGAIVATTDPVAVIGIFRDIGAPARLTRLLEGESLLNDAAAITLFTLLLDILIGGRPIGAGSAALAFARAFLGGLAVGLVAGRVAVGLMSWLRDQRFAQVTLTLALPYIAYIGGEHFLHVSGVVATVAAGLALNAVAQPRVSPDDWHFLNDVWEQLAFWASSLIFLLASLLVPRLVEDVGWYDGFLVLTVVVAALAARALVLFGLLPALTTIGFSQSVSHRHKTMIVWGGLRGAVTLALALAVTENVSIGLDVQRFIAVLATGFVLFTLLVNGLTLRPLMRLLGLDRLSAFDQALRDQVLTLSRERVVESVQQMGRAYGFPRELTSEVADAYRTESAEATSLTMRARDDDRLRLGAVALATRERELVLARFAARAISGRVVREMIADADRLIERTRARGLAEYRETARQGSALSWSFRAGHFLHRRFRIDRLLVDRLADRFERFLALRVVLEELTRYVDDKLGYVVGPRLAPQLREAVQQRQQTADALLEAFRAEYAEYSLLLERRFLHRVALAREDEEYRSLFDERLIGPELYAALRRELDASREKADVRPRLDLGLESRGLIARVPLLASLTSEQLDDIAQLLVPRVAMPGEQVSAGGQRDGRLYVISSGVAEALTGGQRLLLTRGDMFGDAALARDVPPDAEIRALSYCQLLVLERRGVEELLKRHPTLGKH